MYYKLGNSSGGCNSTTGNCTVCVCGDAGYDTSSSTLTGSNVSPTSSATTIRVIYVDNSNSTTSTNTDDDDDGTTGVREPAQ